MFIAGAAWQGCAEMWKHATNDQKCSELWWSCVPLSVKSYGVWDKQPRGVFHFLLSNIIFELHGRLNLALARAGIRGIMSRSSTLDFLAWLSGEEGVGGCLPTVQLNDISFNAPAAPSAPTITSLTNTYSNQRTVTVTWTSVPTATSYNVSIHGRFNTLKTWTLGLRPWWILTT